MTSTNHTLKNTIQTLQAAKLEREVTIDELRACVRQYQHTLRDQQQQQQQQQQQGIAPIGTVGDTPFSTPATATPANTTTTASTTSPPPTTDPDLALVPTPSGQAPVCQRCVRLEARLRSQKQHMIRMQQVSTLLFPFYTLSFPSYPLIFPRINPPVNEHTYIHTLLHNRRFAVIATLWSTCLYPLIPPFHSHLSLTLTIHVYTQ